MMKNPFEAFQIPSEMRTLAEQSMEQARRAFDGFAKAANEAAAQIEDQAQTSKTGAKDATQRVIAFAEENVANSFAYAQKLMRARDPAEFLKMHAEYVQAQLKVLGEQAEELGDSALKAAAKAARGTPRKS
jgi:phasin